MPRTLLVSILLCSQLSVGCTPGEAIVYTSGSTTYEGEEGIWVQTIDYITIGLGVLGATTVVVFGLASEAAVDRRDVERALAGAPSRFTTDLAAGLSLPARDVPRLQGVLRQHRARLRRALCQPTVAPVTGVPGDLTRCTLDRAGLAVFWREVLDALASEPWLAERVRPMRARLAHIEAALGLASRSAAVP